MEAVFVPKNEDGKCDDAMWVVTVCGLFFPPKAAWKKALALKNKDRKFKAHATHGTCRISHT